MSVLQLARSDTRTNRGVRDVAELGAIADAAVNMTILAMLGPPATRPTVNTGPAAVRFAGVDVQVSIMDESGKIDLNIVSASALGKVLAAVGVDPAQADGMAEQIVAARSAATGGQDYQSVAALQLVPGMTPAVYRRLAVLLTVYSQSQWIDPSYASLDALSMFRVFDSGADNAWRQLVEQRTGLRPAPSRKPGVVVGHAFTITAEAAAAGARVTRVAAVRLTGQPQSPLLVYGWR
jgi:general secretion pathway protein K